MSVVIPPIFFYVFGAVLVVAGVARGLWLGRRHPSREVREDDAAAAKVRRRHLAFGVVWVLLGLFLILTTAGKMKFFSGS